MATSEAQKRAAAKWDKENVTTLGCKVKRAEATAFKEYSAKRGKTSNTVLKEYVIKCISKDNEKEAEDWIPASFKFLLKYYILI